ncbi:MAG: hypothetical protein KDJ75_01155 [Alphaproteobacteria bacterium]|nr:hypothetical protein [Alphaproteobacteria bacterium]
MNIKKLLTGTSKTKLVIAAFIVGGILFVAFLDPHDPEYHQAVDQELKLAKRVCEESLGWVMQNPERLKMDNSSLEHIKINGQSVRFEKIKPPYVLFWHSGFVHPGAANEIYCTFSDPRDSTADFYYSYEQRIWIDKIRFRR